MEGSTPEILTPQVTPTQEVPTNYAASIQAIFPNPALGQVHIQLDLTKSARYRLTILDIYGREINKLIDGYGKPAAQIIQWDGRNGAGQAQPAGLYFVELMVGNERLVRPLILQK